MVRSTSEVDWISCLDNQQIIEYFDLRSAIGTACSSAGSGHNVIAFGHCLTVLDGFADNYIENTNAFVSIYLVEGVSDPLLEQEVFTIAVDPGEIELTSQKICGAPDEFAINYPCKRVRIVYGQTFDLDAVRTWREGFERIKQTGLFSCVSNIEKIHVSQRYPTKSIIEDEV